MKVAFPLKHKPPHIFLMTKMVILTFVSVFKIMMMNVS